jgi:hypothetical protein
VYVEKPVDLKRFLKLVEATLRGASNDVAPHERRRAERYAVRREVEVRLDGARFAPAFTVDLSETGMCLDVGFEPGPGSLVAVAFVLSDGTRLELETRVRHARGGRVGVEFLGPDDAQRHLVAALMSN